MSRITLMRRAIRNWSSPMVPRHINRSNQRKWLQAVERLGDAWLLAKPVERKQ